MKSKVSVVPGYVLSWLSRIAIGPLLAGACIGAVAQPNLSNLVAALQGVPDGAWVKVNLNQFQNAWVPDDRRPLHEATNPSPSAIIDAWSSFAWDSKRGDLLLFGGGHANYAGNEMYRWRGRTQQWEFIALPSEVVYGDAPALYFSVDGPLNSPASAHTYDNNLYLPLADRFITFGGASFNTGAGYVRRLRDGSLRATGPYTFDLTKANANVLGGATGGQVNRAGTFGNTLGGFMWDNRDAYGPSVFGSAGAPTNFVSGYSAYAQEAGKDVVYLGGKATYATDNQLFRYTIVDPDDPSQDRWEKLGRYWGGSTGAGSAAIWPERGLFVFTAASNASIPFGFWNLNTGNPENNNINFLPADLTGGQFDYSRMYGAGMDFHPGTGTFKVWYGGDTVYTLTPPATNVAVGWTLARDSTASLIAPPATLFNEVWGKFKYIPNLNAFMALEGGTAGNVWLYRPQGWSAPSLPTANADPVVSLTSPVDFSWTTPTLNVSLAASASDVDSAIASVEFLVDGEVVAVSTAAPYTATLTSLPLGLRAIAARARDSHGNTGISQSRGLWVLPSPNQAPSVAITSPAASSSFSQGSLVSVAASASDTDGSISKVEFFVDGVLVHTDTISPYTASLSGLPVGVHQISAVAYDNFSTPSTPAQIGITVVAVANIPPSVILASPVANTFVPQNAGISISANATDVDGSVVRVEFYVNGALDRTIAAPGPYSYSFAPPTLGTYSVHARAVDNIGAATLSATSTVEVVAPVIESVATLQNGTNGYFGTSDTYLSTYAKNSNFGADVKLLEETAYTNLLRFAIFGSEGGPVPNGATIVSAKLQIYKTSNTYDGVFGAYRMLRAWDATQATWNSPAAGATWTVAGVPLSGGDVNPTPDGTGAVGWSAGLVTIDVTPSLQHFAANGGNHGWLFRMQSGNGNTKFFASSEAATLTQRPKLEVRYVAPPNTPPTVSLSSPVTGASFVAGSTVSLQASATDSDGSVVKVAFFVDGSLVHTVNGSGPYSFTTSALAVGTRQLTAVATDNLGATTTSAVVSITITEPTPNVPPTVSITSPAAAASFVQGSSVTMQASASDSDGSVVKVEFYVDGALLETVSGAGPYQVTTSALAAGTHSLTAVATDNAGGVTVSAAVSITIVAAPTPITVVLQDGVNGYVGTSDVYLSRYHLNGNFGLSSTMLQEGAYVGLVRFAIFASEGGPVPDDATIASATLGIYKVTNAYDGTFTARRLLVPWSETAATWSVRQSGVAWGASGGNASGVDYHPTADGTATIGWTAGWLSIDVTAGVQAFRATPGTNFGWRVDMATGNSNLKQFATRENSNAAQRPKLTITYTQ
jgi:hypothetical protein